MDDRDVFVLAKTKEHVSQLLSAHASKDHSSPVLRLDKVREVLGLDVSMICDLISYSDMLTSDGRLTVVVLILWRTYVLHLVDTSALGATSDWSFARHLHLLSIFSHGGSFRVALLLATGRRVSLPGIRYSQQTAHHQPT